MTKTTSGRNNRFPKRGEVYWINLDPTIGAETKKKRPGLVVSNDIGNELSDLIIIAPITSKVKKVYSFEVKTTISNREAKIMLNQCRAIDKSRVGEKLDQVKEETMQLVDAAIKIVFGLS